MDSTPFEDESNNPFADPSVKTAAGVYNPAPYNPFESESASNSTAYSYVPTSSSSSSSTPKTTNNTTTTTNHSHQSGKKHKSDEEDPLWNEDQGNSSSSDSASVREANLKRREALLLERERKLQEREQLARAQGMQPANWPFKCYPIAYHSISDEIPLQHQSLLSKFYILVVFTWVVLLWNWITVLARWFTKDADGSSTQAMWATIYLVVGVPGGWQLWYRSIYYGARDNANTKWIMGLVNFAGHTIFCAVMAVGIPNTAGAGFMMMIDLFINSFPINGIFALVATFLWVIDGITSAFLFRRAYQVWKASGGEKKTQKEAGEALMQNV